jgi:hypothetical protein
MTLGIIFLLLSAVTLLVIIPSTLWADQEDRLRSSALHRRPPAVPPR